MIIKGGSRSRAGALAVHVLRTDENERVRVVELMGVAADTVQGAFAEMAAQACGTRATKPLYHVSISPDPKAPPMTSAQWAIAIDRLEAGLGLTGCARSVLEHQKYGGNGELRTHRHVVWSRTSPLTGRIVPDRWNFRIHERVGRELEAIFAHAPVCGGLVRSSDQERPQRNPKDWEEQQGARTGIDPSAIKVTVTAIWWASNSGRAFQAGLAAAGLILARGDKPGVLVLIDDSGGLHGLGRRIEGVKAAEIRARLSDLNLATLPTIKQARARLKEKDGGKVAKSPSRTSPPDPRQAPTRSGRLPKPRSLKGPRPPSSQHRRAGLQRGGGFAPKQPRPKLTSVIVDFAIPEDRPGVDPLEIMDAIQKLKRALGNGAEVGESLRKLEALYGRLMLNS